MFEDVRYVHSGKFSSRDTWRHGERIITSYELILVTKGEVAIHTGNEAYTLHPGDVLRLDPGVPHGGTRDTDEPVGFFWLHFLTSHKEELPPPFLHPGTSARIELLCRELLHYANTPGYPHEACDSVVRLILMELLHHATCATDTSGKSDKLFREICEWTRINCDLPLTVSGIAAQFGYNEDYLSRYFHRFYPDGLKNYIDRVKLEAIKNALANAHLSLAEISSRYGFSDYKYFLKYFKYHENITPTAYRRLFRGIHTNNR